MAFMLCGSSKSHHVSMDTVCDVKPTLNVHIPDVNQDVEGMEAFMFRIPRGRKGFGFTITGSSPVKVGQVKEGTGAASVGLARGDSIARINGQNVSRSMADSVARLIRNCDTVLELVVYREYAPPNACSTPVPSRDQENRAPRYPLNDNRSLKSHNDENCPPHYNHNFATQKSFVQSNENRAPKFARQDVGLRQRQPQQTSQCSGHNNDYIPMRGGSGSVQLQKLTMAPPIGMAPIHETHETPEQQQQHQQQPQHFSSSSSASSSSRRLHRMSQVLPPLLLSYQTLTPQEQARQEIGRAHV